MLFKATFKAPTVAQEKAGVITFVTLQFVSQAAHVGFGYIFVTMPALIASHFCTIDTVKRIGWISGAVVLIGSGIKEIWDVNGLEDPVTSGGVKGSWQDFGFWCLGNALGLAMLEVAGL
jgi:hypothetical protein